MAEVVWQLRVFLEEEAHDGSYVTANRAILLLDTRPYWSLEKVAQDVLAHAGTLPTKLGYSVLMFPDASDEHWEFPHRGPFGGDRP